jgi:hypothetical protein
VWFLLSSDASFTLSFTVSFSSHLQNTGYYQERQTPEMKKGPANGMVPV